MSYALALASGLLFGAADFLGGLTARRASTLATVVVSQLAGLIILIVALPLLPDAVPTPRDFAWGAAAGLAGGVGVALLYRALAVGTMAIVAPITASCAVAIPVAADLLGGAQPGMRVGAGIVLAIVAIVFLSQARTAGAAARPGGVPSGLGLALAAGAAIGFFFLLLARAGDAGLWPLVSARVVSVGLFGAAAVISGTRLVMARQSLGMAVGGGALDMVANALYLIATRDGELSAVVTLASLYPASTVLLARVVLAERLTVLQNAGIACALIAVLLIVAP